MRTKSSARHLWARACVPCNCVLYDCCCTLSPRACMSVLATHIEVTMAHMPMKELIRAQSLAARLRTLRLFAPQLRPDKRLSTNTPRLREAPGLLPLRREGATAL